MPLVSKTSLGNEICNSQLPVLVTSSLSLLRKTSFISTLVVFVTKNKVHLAEKVFLLCEKHNQGLRRQGTSPWLLGQSIIVHDSIKKLTNARMGFVHFPCYFLLLWGSEAL